MAASPQPAFFGLQIQAQVPVGGYIADFVCFETRLIVEADGSQQAECARDTRRDAWFEANGFRIRRFWNADMLYRQEEVAETLWLPEDEAAQLRFELEAEMARLETARAWPARSVSRPYQDLIKT